MAKLTGCAGEVDWDGQDQVGRTSIVTHTHAAANRTSSNFAAKPKEFYCVGLFMKKKP